MLEVMFLKLNTKLTPGWTLIQVNFDPIAIPEIGPKGGGVCSFVSGHSSARLRNIKF